jgi:hypothetical protein
LGERRFGRKNASKICNSPVLEKSKDSCSPVLSSLRKRKLRDVTVNHEEILDSKQKMSDKMLMLAESDSPAKKSRSSSDGLSQISVEPKQTEFLTNEHKSSNATKTKVMEEPAQSNRQGSEPGLTTFSPADDTSQPTNLGDNWSSEDKLINVACLSPPRTSLYLCVDCGATYTSYSVYTYHRKLSVCANAPSAAAVRLSFLDSVNQTSLGNSLPMNTLVASKASASNDFKPIAGQCSTPSSSFRVCGRAAAVGRHKRVVEARVKGARFCSAASPRRTR